MVAGTRVMAKKQTELCDRPRGSSNAGLSLSPSSRCSPHYRPTTLRGVRQEATLFRRWLTEKTTG